MYKKIRESKYEINEKGEIRNRETKQILKQQDKEGYRTISLNLGDGKKKYKVHRLVGECFIPNPENKPQINHKNMIRDDNRVENLEWVSGEENVRHAQINSPRFTPSKSVIEVNIETKEIRIHRSMYEASKAKIGHYATEKEIENTRNAVKRCCENKQAYCKGSYYFYNTEENMKNIAELVKEKEIEKYTEEEKMLIKENNLNEAIIKYRINKLGMSKEEALKYKKGYVFNKKYTPREYQMNPNSRLALGVGKRFGKLIVEEIVREKGKKAKYRCKCDCGGKITTQYTNLWVGKVKSCGCLNGNNQYRKLSWYNGI